MCKHEQTKKISCYKKYNIHKCKTCDLVLNLSDLKSNYDYEDYYDEDSGGRFNFFIELIVKAFRFGRALGIKIIDSKAKSILDIGSGRGYMLYYLKNLGFKTTIGTQISLPARKFSQEKLGLDVRGKDMLEINFEEKFDIISMYHVFEHIKDPEKYIERISDLLNTNGKLVLQVPNFDSWTNRISHDYWLALDPEHHLYNYTYYYLKPLLEKNGFKIIKFNSFSLEYSIFTSVQSLVNKFTETENFFFNFLQKPKFSYMILLHVILFILLTPLVFIINLALFYSKSGENLNIVARKI